MKHRHDVDDSIRCCSEEVEILFSALHSTISEIGEKAIAWQGRNLTTHVTEIVSCYLYFTPCFSSEY